VALVVWEQTWPNPARVRKKNKMTAANKFSNLDQESGLKVLNTHLQDKSYITGYVLQMR
jgi:hypothetical protein